MFQLKKEKNPLLEEGLNTKKFNESTQFKTVIKPHT